MTLLKCKMCGGDLEFHQNKAIGTCMYCGSTMTLPNDTDEKHINLFNRANHYRRNNDFDKAQGIYEMILLEHASSAEAHWGIVLCKYGIEYVDDPKSNAKIPTCHRTQFESILQDPDFKEAIKHAESEAKALYEQEARHIDALQKKILEISSKEPPFDVFICYKETDALGNRTKDSVLAQDIYYSLIQEGFNVFFSRITLEDKLGSAYEPYIFAALNTSKVMLVLGTLPEHFTSTWTKNEWSRYLALIKKGDKKLLIPAYRDMDPYDLPDEFSSLQALDMGKLGFIQDLVRGIKKIVVDNQSKTSLEKETAPPHSPTESLVDRAFLCIEDQDYKKADDLLEQVLNSDPRHAKSYIGKLLIERQMRHQEDLETATLPLDDSPHYQKALRFAAAPIKDQLIAYNHSIQNRINNETIYFEACDFMHRCSEYHEYMSVIDSFRKIQGYKDVDALIDTCLTLAEKAKKTALLREEDQKKSLYSDARDCMLRKQFDEAIALLTQLDGYKDTAELINECKSLKQHAAYETRKKKKLIIAIACVCLLIALSYGVYELSIKPMRHYQLAQDFIDHHHYEDAIIELIAAGNYKDSPEKLQEIPLMQAYHLGTQRLARQDLIGALLAFNEAYGYSDSIDQIYAIGEHYLDVGKLDSALDAFSHIKTHPKRDERLYALALTYLVNEEYDTALKIYRSIASYKDSQKQLEAIPLLKHYKKALALVNQEDYSGAISEFKSAGNYKDSQELLYQLAIQLEEADDYPTAIKAFEALGNYKDSPAQLAHVRKGKKITLSRAMQREVNVFLSNFTEVYFDGFIGSPSTEAQIRFAIQHNIMNNQNSVDLGYYYATINKSVVERSIRRFFEKSAGLHTVDNYYYDGSTFSFEYGFPLYVQGPMAVVQELYDKGDGTFTAIFDVVQHEYALGYDITPSELAQKIKNNPNDYKVVAKRQAILGRHTFEGTTRYKLLEYRTLN